ncbi:MAG: PAS domain S-box protein [Deltaproteobacteria bacterium]|nr:PAS domain S-box protein [Deltaproteobacteria bacterium]
MKCRARLLSWLVVVLGVLVPLSGALGAGLDPSAIPPVITVVADDNYPPFIFRDAAGRLQGIVVDQWRLWERHTGIRVELRAMSWARAQLFMAEGRAQVIDTIFANPERGAWLKFTKPYAAIEVPVFFRREIGGISGASSLQGFTVGIKEGDACRGVLEAAGLTQFKLYPSYEELVAAAGRGEVKVFCADLPPAAYYLYKLNLEGEFRHTPPLYTGEFCRAVTLDHAALLARVEEGFAQVTPAEYQAIDRKWRGADLGVNPAQAVYILYALSGGLALLLGLAVWNRSLHTRVSRRTSQLSQAMAAQEAIARKYRDLVERAGSIILQLDPQGRLTFLNEFGQGFFGYSLEEAVGRPFQEICASPGEAGEAAGCALPAELASPGRGQALVREHLTRDGSRVWVAWNSRALSGPDGGLLEVLCVGSDVTEQRQSELALAENEMMLRQLADNLPGVMVYQAVVHPDGRRRFTYVGGNVERLHEVTVEEVMADPSALYDQILPDHLLRLAAAELAAVRDHTPFRAEVQCRLPSGRLAWLDLASTPRRQPDGSVIWDGVEVDTTERKLAEQALAESEERFRILSEESPLGLSLITPDGYYEYLNPAFQKIFGYTLTDIPRGKDWFNLAFPDPAARQEALEHWQKDLEGSRLGEVRPRTFLVTTKTGEQKTVLFRPVTTPSGRQFIIYEDITQRLQAEKDLAQLQEQLYQSQKLEALGMLASGIAHDFNNVLQVISGYVQLVLGVESLPPESRQRLEQVNDSIGRAAGLIKSLVSLARRTEAGRQRVDLNREVARTVKVLGHALPRMIEVRAELEPHLPEVGGDAAQLEQVLLNLGNNAAQAMPQGGVLQFLTRQVSSRQEPEILPPGLAPGDYVVLEVSDTGVGMDEATRSHVFEPFFTTKPQGEGTGLGLSTAYGIVTNHGGRIFCQSAPGRGATFTVYLPVSRERGAGPGKAAKAPPRDYRGQETVLLVDDEPDILLTCREILASQGYQVLTAESGEEALGLFQEGVDIQLVVLDLSMPGMGGLKCLEAIKELRPEARVLVATGYAGEGVVQTIQELGGTDLVTKPYRVADLLEKVRSLLDQGREPAGGR